MDDLKNALANIINNSETNSELETLTNMQDVYKVFTENGYTGSYEDFEKDVIDFFVKAEMSDYELEKISGGKSQKANKILAGMFSALTISNPLMNISAAALDKTPEGAYDLQKTNTSQSGNILDKFTAFFKSNTGKNVAAGSALLGTPLAALGLGALYKHFTSLNHKFSQIINYCLENKNQKTTKQAEAKYVKMLKEISKEYRDAIQKQNRQTTSADGDPQAAQTGKDLNDELGRMDGYVTELSDTSSHVTVQRLGEIASDDFFVSTQLNVPKLQEFLATFGKKPVNPLQAQLDQANQLLGQTQQQLAQVNQDLTQEQQQHAQTRQDLTQEQTQHAQTRQNLIQAQNDLAQRNQELADQNKNISILQKTITNFGRENAASRMKYAMTVFEQALKEYYGSSSPEEKKALATKLLNAQKFALASFAGGDYKTDDGASHIINREDSYIYHHLFTHQADNDKLVSHVKNNNLAKLINWACAQPAPNGDVIIQMFDENDGHALHERGALPYDLVLTSLCFNLSQLHPKDIYDCINFVLNPQIDLEHMPSTFCVKYFSKHTAYTKHEELRSRRVARQMLAQELIGKCVTENEALWKNQIERLGADESPTPHDTLSYYVKVLLGLRNHLREDRYKDYFPLNGYARVFMPIEQYYYIRNYILSACDTISNTLRNADNASAKEAANQINNHLKEFNEIDPLEDRAYANFVPLVELLDNVCTSIDRLNLEETDLKAKVNALSKSYTRINSRSTEWASRRDALSTACYYSNEAYVTDTPQPSPQHDQATRTKYASKWFGNINPKATPGKEQWAGLVDMANKNTIVVAYHGTDCAADAWTDIKCFFNPDCVFLGNKKVHRGFHERYMQTRDDMKAKLTETINKSFPATADRSNLKIILTGHSLGGALSTLAALDLVQDAKLLGELGIRPDQIDLITFCSPRVLTLDAYEHVKTNTKSPQKRLLDTAIRFWRDRDTVAAVPTGSMGFKHFGQSWRLNKKPDNVGEIARKADPFSHHYMADIESDIDTFIANPDSVMVERVDDGAGSPPASPSPEQK